MGVISIAPELESKRMELLREAVPGVSRVATFLDSTYLPYREGETSKSRPERWGFTFIPIGVQARGRRVRGLGSRGPGRGPRYQHG
jgi:hypothetical protein